MIEQDTSPSEPENHNPQAAENDVRETTEFPFNGCQDDPLQEMMSGNFIEYASYSIKERAIPHIDDGLKPVQRRILHSLHQIDDGRYHKVANVIGHTMQYHPHGDASIGDALIVLANKKYFIDPQGNFGNIFTGDDASAPRYIECRLTELAREVMFNPEITEFVDSYDGRNREPVTLPAKIPSLLLLGADGIAVGMRTRILPHNFNELLKAQIKILKGGSVNIYPDFPTRGTIDVSDYEDGYGRVKVRAVIEKKNDKTLTIREIPYTTSTESLISSIEDAARKGKIKISSIHDFTAENVEIEINLPRGVHAEETRRQLYAYTDCELNIGSQIIVINNNQPVQMGVNDILRHITDKLLEYLQRELQIELDKLHDRFHDKTLARIFIENRIYKRIEESETYPKVISEVRRGLEPFRKQLKREITDEDIEKLLQIQIKRISRFDLNQNQAEIERIIKAIGETEEALANLTDHTINYLKALLKKYGKLFPRQTKITDLEEVDARKVARRNIKVGHDRKNHFLGSNVRNSNKNEEYLLCSEFDRLILLRSDGSFKVIPVPTKTYIGAVKHVFIADRQQVYSMIYRDRKTKRHYVKRFKIDRYITKREYRTIPKGCVVESVFTNQGVVLRAEFKHKSKGSEDFQDIEMDNVEMRSTTARGFKISSREISSFSQIKRGSSAAPAPMSEENPKIQEEDPQEQSSQKKAVPGGKQEAGCAQSEKNGKKPVKKSSKKNPGKNKKKKPDTEKASPPPEPQGESSHTPGNGTPNKKTAAPPEAESSTDNTARKKGHILIDEDTPFFLE